MLCRHAMKIRKEVVYRMQEQDTKQDFGYGPAIAKLKYQPLLWKIRCLANRTPVLAVLERRCKTRCMERMTATVQNPYIAVCRG